MSTIGKVLGAIVSNIIQNIDTYPAVVGAFLAAIWCFFSGERVESAILATMGIIAVSLIVNRGKMTSFDNNVSNVRGSFQDMKNGVDDLHVFMQERLETIEQRSTFRLYNRTHRLKKTEDQVQGAKDTVWLMSESPNKVLSSNTRGEILRKLEEGCELRIIMLEPTENNIEFVGESNPAFKRDPQNLKSYMYTAVLAYEDIALEIRSDQIQMRTWKSPFRYGLLITDHEDRKRGLCRVEMRLHERKVEERPNFYLTATGEPEWFDLFVDQFDLIWKTAEPINIPHMKKLLKPKEKEAPSTDTPNV